MRLSVLLHFDPTVGTIKSELLFLDRLVKMIDPSEVVLVKGMQRAEKLLASVDVEFPYTVTEVDDLSPTDAVIAWNSTNMANFFGGVISETNVKYYEFISHHSHLGVPILYRSGDSENEIFDYRALALERSVREISGGKSKFTDLNHDLLERLTACKPINYDSYHLLVNGERDKLDWVVDTYRVRKPHPHLSDQMLSQALYLGDDLFFQVLEKYEAHVEPRHVKPISPDLYWIGFIEHRNAGRKKIFTKLLDNIKIPVTLQTNTEFQLPGVTCINESVVGDTSEYFDLLASHLGYVFIGKGTSHCTYVNKTIYDCFIARIPVLVYTETDQGRMIFPEVLAASYFKDQRELVRQYQRLLDPEYRDSLIKAQANSLIRRLSPLPPDVDRLYSLFSKIPRVSRPQLLKF
jgi:hypothetical protein